MNAAVRATVRVGLYTGAKVYFVHEVSAAFCLFVLNIPLIIYPYNVKSHPQLACRCTVCETIQNPKPKAAISALIILANFLSAAKKIVPSLLSTSPP